jgi:myo-inositol-1(or 4)-monophosphatase
VRGGGAFRNGCRIAVSEIDVMSRALIGTGFPFKSMHLMPEYGTQLDAVLRVTAGVRRAGSAALDLCHVATGWLDGFWELDLAPWDIAAGVLMVREAGGVITRIDGTDDMMTSGTVLAGNRAVHAGLGRILHSTTAADAAPDNGRGS